MKRLLIISEDVVKIQTYTGFLGRLYSRVYIGWLKWRIKLLMPFFRGKTVVSNGIGFKGKEVIFYGDILARADYAKEREWYWQVTRRLLKNLPNAGLFNTRLATYLAYHYLIYRQVYVSLIEELNPDRIVLMGNSYHEQIAAEIGKSRNVPVTKIRWLSLSWLQKLVQTYLLNREYSLKIKNFIGQMGYDRPALKQKAVFLSADFYRHLKTLVPLYRRLSGQNIPAYLVTDVNNLKPTLDSLYIHQPETVFLAGFFPKSESHKIAAWRKEFSRINLSRSDDYFDRLCLEAAEPMIRKSLFLSQLYLAAAENLFKKLKPKGVVVVSDLRFCELALAVMAKKFRVRSVLASPNTMVDLTGINPYQSADKVVVVGNYIRKQLVAIGVEEKKICVAGDLVKENVSEARYQINRQKIYEILKIPQEKQLALLISFRPTWMIPREEKEAYIRLAVNAVNQVPGVFLVIKPHPTEKRYRVQEELADWGIDNAVVSDNDKISLLDLLHACSVVLQTWSFTIFEAIMINRPVIVINPFSKNYNNFLPLIGRGGAVETHDLKSLKHWLRVLINPKNPATKNQLTRARQASREFIHFSNGEASGKVVKLLLGK